MDEPSATNGNHRHDAAVPTAGDSAVNAHGLVHRFGRSDALRGVSLQIPTGEIFGLLGPNGAGKTTTIRILLTLLRPTSGTALVAGYDIIRARDAVRRSVGWVPQDRAVDPLLSARENLRFAAGLYHVPPSALTQRGEELLDLVGLTADADRLVNTYSGGMRRRLELAMGLVHRPSVLFLDEPTLGLDIAARRTVWAHIEHIRQLGTTIVLTTHYLDEADSICDRIAIIDHGQFKAVGTPLELKRAHGINWLHIDFGQPATEPQQRLVHRIRAHPCVQESRCHDGLVEAATDDLVGLTTFVVGECAQTGVTPRDLWGRHASLDDVFLNRTGQSLSDNGGTRTDGQVTSA